MDKKLKKLIHETSLELYTDREIIESVFSSYYEILKDEMDKANKEDPSSFPSIQIKYLGKLTVNPFKVKKLNDKLNDKKNKIREVE